MSSHHSLCYVLALCGNKVQSVNPSICVWDVLAIFIDRQCVPTISNTMQVIEMNAGIGFQVKQYIHPGRKRIHKLIYHLPYPAGWCSGNAQDICSGGVLFGTPTIFSGDFVVSLTSSSQMPELYCLFLPIPFQYTIH